MEISNSAVLLITFNRLDYTQKVIDKLKACNIERLYIFNDGPRNKEDEVIREQILFLIKQTDWINEPKTWFSDNNLGCGYGPASAISWVLEKEDKIIILEDDCIPTQSFFDFCNHNLTKYQTDNRVGAIVGRSHHDIPQLFSGNDYIFSHYGFTWGWATWKRVWENYDIEMKSWEVFKKQGGFLNTFFSIEEVEYFDTFYEQNYLNKDLKSHVWDYQFFFQMYSSNFLFIVPAKNLVENIGYIGVHFHKKMKEHTIKAVEGFKIMNEPKFVQANRKYDFYYFKNTIKIRAFYKRVLYKIESLFHD